MRIFRHFDDLPDDVFGGAVAIGNFDGVHRGHHAVIAEAGRIAKAAGHPWGVLTLEPHPRNIFTPGEPPFRLTPFRIKARHIEALGVDYLTVLHFDKDFARRSAESFVHDVLVGGLKANHVVCGYDFVFGHGRKGDSEMLLHMGKEEGYGFTCVPPYNDENGIVFSSTRARECLKAGDPKGAAHVLGRCFEIEGRVERGDNRGHAIGFPTANIHLDEYIRPATGVYAVKGGVDMGVDTVWLDGVANFGNRPTFNGQDVVLEAHFFGYDEDLYAKHLRVALVEYIRPEKKFGGMEDLKAQIAKDCAKAKEILADHTCKITI